MFALLNILTHSYNFLFYELSDYHCFIIKVRAIFQSNFRKCIPEEEKVKMLEASYRTLTNISSSNPNEFAASARPYLDKLLKERESHERNLKLEAQKFESDGGADADFEDQEFLEEGQIEAYFDG